MTLQTTALASDALLLPIKSVSAITGLSPSSIKRMIGRGDLIARKIGARTLVESGSVRALVENAPLVSYR